jgi:adenylate cyclase
MSGNSLLQRIKNLGFLRKSRAYQITTIIIAASLGVAAGILSYTRVLYPVDEAMTSFIYRYNPLAMSDPHFFFSQDLKDVNPYFLSYFYGIMIGVFYILFSSRKKLFALVGQLIMGSAVVGIADLLHRAGYRLLLLIPLLFSVASILIFLCQHSILNFIERKRMERTLKMYVDAHVVDELTETYPFALSRLSERKDIAVLFVDIRGFTSMSEQLEPEQVVTVLNDYFTLIYAAIKGWNGTLDKFIGDAAMAIFNAPQSDEDYVFHALCAADEIRQGFSEIADKYKAQYGREIHVGIGINAGEAIVGNIGCLHRMDYTAIGDTVNTASRLESNAAADQILISKEVLSHIGNLAETEFVGELSLKGKSLPVPAYNVTRVPDKPSAPNQSARKEFLNEARLLYSKMGANFQIPEFLRRI